MKEGDDEPTIGVGHLTLRVSDVATSAEFYKALGMREAHPRSRNMAILELRGGTHLLLFGVKKKPRARPVPFDLMVDDVDAIQQMLKAAGHEVGPMMIDRFSSHRSFVCEDPDGHVLTFTSGHTDDEAPSDQALS